jgi:hypothetical protein
MVVSDWPHVTVALPLRKMPSVHIQAEAELSGRFGAEKNFLPLPRQKRERFFGLLFSLFDKSKIFKSHYRNLKFSSTLINIIFVSQITETPILVAARSMA